MIKSELVDRVYEEVRETLPHQHGQLKRFDIERVVNAILEEIMAALERGDRVELRGFGAFTVKSRPPRIGRNPRTGERVEVEGKHVPLFKTGKELRERLNGDAGDTADEGEPDASEASGSPSSAVQANVGRR